MSTPFDPEIDKAAKENISTALMIQSQGLSVIKDCYDNLSTKTAEDAENAISAAREFFAAASEHLDVGIRQLLQR